MGTRIVNARDSIVLEQYNQIALHYIKIYTQMYIYELRVSQQIV